jgi:rRNA maturation endonuclease Nob1
MKFSVTCQSCNRRVALTYDEMDSTPAFCPFCGEEFGEDPQSSYDDAPGITGADADDAWDDDDR